MFNGVLVERTVGDIIPALETNAEGLKKVLDSLVKEYKKKQEEMDNWKARFLSIFIAVFLFVTSFFFKIALHIANQCMLYLFFHIA